MGDKRLIEVDFPLKEVSEESLREKNIRHGHISTLHIWWARRPLAASRATTFAALVPAPKDRDELRKQLEFVAELSKWENSLNKRLIENAKKQIRDFFGGVPPKVLDCFAGGGAIPFEASRLGCVTYALEYNPVAVVILKAMLQYPQKFSKEKTEVTEGLHSVSNPFEEDVKKYGNRIIEEARKEVGKFYPFDPDGSIPVGYIWARTVRCPNPSCSVEIPLLRQLWLAKKKKIALKILVDKKNKKIDFKLVREKDIDFDPSEGTTRKATAMCPVCGTGIDDDMMKKEAKEGRMGQRLIAVVLHGKKGKTYRIAKEADIEIFRKAADYFADKMNRLRYLMPDEEIPFELANSSLRFRHYNNATWGSLFNARQKLTLVTFLEKIREIMQQENIDDEYKKAIITYLSLIFDNVSTSCNTLCRWENTKELIADPFSRHALPMTWDYVECNPFSNSTGSWSSYLRYIAKVIRHCSEVSPGNVAQGTASRLEYPDDFFDAIITDPPYYDNVNYAELSDFFYVWLKRIIGDIYPELFSTPLTPKSQEIVMNSVTWDGDTKKAKDFFENMITKSFKEIHRVLKPDGIAVIVFAYKSTEAWETIINSLIKSGLVLTASWPIKTEMKQRMRAKESAALASSVYMICRKSSRKDVTYFNEIKEKIENRIKEKLAQFWEQGISGADFFVSAIGPAVEVFGRYSRVEKLSGEEVSVQELLEYVRKIVSEFALERVLKRADLGGVDAETRFYLLWRWTFGNAKVHFDDAIKLSRPMGVELTQLWDGGSLVKKEKEFVRVLTPHERAKDPAFLKKTKLTSMIDVLHYVSALWERGEREKIKEVLNETGYAGNEVFWQTAQAISEILPQGDKEKQLLQGFLYGKEVYVKEARGKTSLLDYMESK
jgi:adenine-specific DNA methylase